MQGSIKNMEKEIFELNNDIKDLNKEKHKNLMMTTQAQEAEYDKQIKDNEKEMERLDQKLEECSQFEDKREEIEEHVEKLKERLEKERQEHEMELAEKEEEKHQAIEKLRKDMLFQIKETKAELLSLNDAELQNTTKLTIQQNHQLTSELEFQSKQTETLLYKNNKMSEQIVALRKDIEIHKQVENELAKRSHFCQKVIK